ncbi:MAG: hypothetical protein JXA82_16685 [Sedimentisphaerales bacterium]|nr:hypothetical protein [Sedimentisphaerales bacterium]
MEYRTLEFSHGNETNQSGQISRQYRLTNDWRSSMMAKMPLKSHGCEESHESRYWPGLVGPAVTGTD